jgi:hypothetical protein
MLGNLMLLFNIAFWRRKQKGLSTMGRVGYTLALGLAIWTYPQALEQSRIWPIVYWCPCITFNV